MNTLIPDASPKGRYSTTPIVERTFTAIAALLFTGLFLAGCGAPAYRDVSFEPMPMMYGDTARTGEPFAKDPTVIRLGGRYLMYYSARGYSDVYMPSAEEYAAGPLAACATAADLAASDTAVTAPQTDVRPSNMLKGGWHSAIAESRDLVNWTRVGDMDLRSARGEAIWGATAPCVKVFDGKVHMFYQRWYAGAGTGGNNVIFHATSSDGLHFRNTTDEPVLIPRTGWSIERAIDAEVYRVGEKMILLFATRDLSGEIQMLAMAEAPYDSDYGPDKWTLLSTDGPLLEPEYEWEGHCIEAPTVIKHKGLWYMFYAGAYNHEHQQIGLAVSKDGYNFERVGENGLVYTSGPEGSWNAGESGHPGVFRDDDGLTYLFYQGKASHDADYLLSVSRIGF